MTFLGSTPTETIRTLAQPLLRWGLGGLFVWSGLEKLSHAEVFQQAVLNYNLLPMGLAKIYAVMLPWVEILAGGYLMIGLFTRFSAGLISVMMVSFVIAISLVLIRGDAIDCGCFVGGKFEPITPAKLLEDLAILAVSLYLVWAPPGFWSLDNRLKNPGTDVEKPPSPVEKP